MSEAAAREEVLSVAQAMAREHLSPGTSGNISARVPGGMVITPTGVAYDDLDTDQLCFVGEGGTPRAGELRPSSEWHFHLAIYAARPEVGAIVHTHSDHATAISCTGEGIKAFHYMVAVAGGRDIRCAPYATFGTEELAANAVRALERRRACLLANHGVIACGETPKAALGLAWEVEHLSKQFILASQLGHVNYLSDAEMDRVLEKFRTYGQQR